MNAAIDPAAEPQNAYLEKPRGNEEGEGLGIPNRTRLGDDSITLVPVHVVSGGWALYPDGDPFNPDLPLTDSLAKSLFDSSTQAQSEGCCAVFQYSGRSSIFWGTPTTSPS